MVITHIKKHGSYYNINYGEKFIPQDSFIYKKDIEEFLASGGEIEEEVTDAERLEQLKNTLPGDIDAARDAEINNGVEFKGKMFQSAEKDRNLLTSTVTLYSAVGSVPEGFAWISTDNTLVAMTLQELIQLGALMGKKVNDCTIKARMLKDQLMKATSYEEASKISWYPQVNEADDPNANREETSRESNGPDETSGDSIQPDETPKEATEQAIELNEAPKETNQESVQSEQAEKETSEQSDELNQIPKEANDESVESNPSDVQSDVSAEPVQTQTETSEVSAEPNETHIEN